MSYSFHRVCRCEEHRDWRRSWPTLVRPSGVCDGGVSVCLCGIACVCLCVYVCGEEVGRDHRTDRSLLFWS